MLNTFCGFPAIARSERRICGTSTSRHTRLERARLVRRVGRERALRRARRGQAPHMTKAAEKNLASRGRSTASAASCIAGNADRTLLRRTHAPRRAAPRRHGAAAVQELCAVAVQKIQPQRRRLLVGGDHVGRRRLDLERHGARGVPVRADGLERVRRLRRGGAGPDVAPLRPARRLGGRPRPQGADRRDRRLLHRGRGGGDVVRR